MLSPERYLACFRLYQFSGHFYFDLGRVSLLREVDDAGGERPSDNVPT
jgi:hypothetical protein